MRREKKGYKMKKVVFGSVLLLSGMLSAAVLLAGGMATEWTVNGELSALKNLSMYGLMPAFYGFLAAAIAGLALALWGLLDKRQ